MLTLVILGGLMIILGIAVHRRTRNERRAIAFGGTGVVVLLIAALLVIFNDDDANADNGNGEDSNETPNSLTVDVKEFDACPSGVASDEPTFYVRGESVSHPRAVTPPLPHNDPDKLIESLFGEDGYACKDPAVAVAMAQVQEGLLPFTEREDQKEVNDWIATLAGNGEKWQQVVDDTVERFRGIRWQSDWTPEDGDATFLLADANEESDYPRLLQREEGLNRGIPVYRFAAHYGDARLLKDLVLTEEYGWLALPEGQFAATPLLEELEEPLFPQPEQQPEEQDQQQEAPDQPKAQGRDDSGTSKAGSDKQADSGRQGGNKSSTGGDTGGGSGGDSGGDNGGHGGGSGGGCGGSGCGTGGGDTGGSGGSGGDCGSSCGGGSGGGDDGGECHDCPKPAPQPPPTTSPPTTAPQPPPTTSPPTTKAPDPGCPVGVPVCTG